MLTLRLLWLIGNGTNQSTRGNAFKVLFNGQTFADGAYASSGADYAEYFEWIDGNPSNEDRVGYFVTIDGEKIRKATSIDDYVLGIVSSNPMVVGDSQMRWKEKYVTDDWGRIQYHQVEVPDKYMETLNPMTKQTERILISEAHTDTVPMLNSDWNSELEYIDRENRPEWSAVGMLGKLLVRDDGTCKVNGYCKPNDDGVATASTVGYRVMKRINENIILVLVR